MTRLRATARRNRKSELGTVESWWAGKYNLPINDPLYRDRTHADLIVELLQDLHERRTEIEAHLRLGTGGERADLEEQLAAINTALGEEMTSSTDEWLEEVEAALAAGQMPSL